MLDLGLGREEAFRVNIKPPDLLPPLRILGQEAGEDQRLVKSIAGRKRAPSQQIAWESFCEVAFHPRRADRSPFIGWTHQGHGRYRLWRLGTNPSQLFPPDLLLAPIGH